MSAGVKIKTGLGLMALGSILMGTSGELEKVRRTEKDRQLDHLGRDLIKYHKLTEEIKAHDSKIAAWQKRWEDCQRTGKMPPIEVHYILTKGKGGTERKQGL